MNACTHLYQSTCPRYPKRPSAGICAACEQYTDSGKPRSAFVPVTVKATTPKPIPRDQWPKWAAAIARLRQPEDVGVGDTAHRELGRVGSLITWSLKKMGLPCRCAERRAEWNVKYGYE